MRDALLHKQDCLIISESAAKRFHNGQRLGDSIFLRLALISVDQRFRSFTPMIFNRAERESRPVQSIRYLSGRVSVNEIQS
jgi:hypothetical protein